MKDERRHKDETKKNHNGTLDRYVVWRLACFERDHIPREITVPSAEEVRAQYLGRGTYTAA